MREFNDLIDVVNESRVKIYYQLNQLVSITGMSIRSLKYRMKKVRVKYQGVESLLCKSGRSWKIHYTLISEFLPINSRKISTLSNHKWETLVSWNTRDAYDIGYHVQLIREIKNEIPTANIAFVLEKDQRGVNHVHAVVDDSKSVVEMAVESVLGKYIDKKYYRSQIETINNIVSVTSYLRKDGQITII